MYETILVDANMMAHRQYHAYKKQQLSIEHNGEIIETGMLFGTLKTLIYLQKQYKSKRIIFLYDSRHSFRKNISSEYKSTRKEKSDSFLTQFCLTTGVLSYLGLKQIKAEDYEADDLIATWITHRIEDDEQTLIISTDKDLYCLLQSNIHMLLHSPKQRLFTSQDFKDKFKFDKSYFPVFLALTGDSVDCIMGLKGIGPKTATKIITKYNGNAKTIAEQFSQEDKERFLLNMMLVALKRNIKTSKMLGMPISRSIKDFWEIIGDLNFKSMFLDKNKEILELIYANSESN